MISLLFPFPPLSVSSLHSSVELLQFLFRHLGPALHRLQRGDLSLRLRSRIRIAAAAVVVVIIVIFSKRSLRHG